MEFKDGFYYTSSHEWFDPSTGRMGLTDHAQSELGDIVFFDCLVDDGDELEKGERLGEIESVKTMSDVYMPVNGKVVARNEELENDSALVNSDPYGEGWLVQIEIDGEPEGLMDVQAYRDSLGE